jgi:hypothetical protein
MSRSGRRIQPASSHEADRGEDREDDDLQPHDGLEDLLARRDRHRVATINTHTRSPMLRECLAICLKAVRRHANTSKRPVRASGKAVDVEPGAILGATPASPGTSLSSTCHRLVVLPTRRA